MSFIKLNKKVGHNENVVHAKFRDTNPVKVIIKGQRVDLLSSIKVQKGEIDHTSQEGAAYCIYSAMKCKSALCN